MAMQTVPVTPDNFIRAESDRYFGAVVKDGGFGKLFHRREPSPIDDQDVVRQNRDTLYSGIFVDLDAGPVTITLPDAGDRFMSMQVFDEDEFVVEVVYAGRRTYTKDKVGTRYMCAAFRTLVDPDNPADLKAVHALQDAIKVEQKAPAASRFPRGMPSARKRCATRFLRWAKPCRIRATPLARETMPTSIRCAV